MGKGGNLTKLKSALKKLPTFNKLEPTTTNSISDYFVAGETTISRKLHPVYVGSSRRRYLVRSEVIDHPLFQVLVNKSNGSDGVSVTCEVVLFQHLVWMLENSDSHLESMDELVDFYSF